jgi:TPR repeat protein
MKDRTGSGRARLLGMAFLLVAWPTLAASPEEDYRVGFEAFNRDDLMGAMEALGRSAEAGYAPAQVLLAYILDKANEDQAAMDLYRKAVEQGSPAGEYGLGTMYAAGEGVERDSETALAYFTSAAEKGHPPAMEVLAGAYLNGGLGLEPDRSMAIHWLERAAEAGYAPAQAQLEVLDAGGAAESSSIPESGR